LQAPSVLSPPDLCARQADRFAVIIESLYRATMKTGRGPRMSPLILLICARLRRIKARFAALAARHAAGTLRPLRAPATEPRTPGLHPPPTQDPLPGRWPVAAVPPPPTRGR
jgi:hypothetical protein